jgi:tRNA(Ile)-lysidine synthase
MTLSAQFAEAVLFTQHEDYGDKIGVAISGGSDSTALLHLVVDWAKTQQKQVFAATVDHGLRKESAVEARDVATKCAELGVVHETLVWTDRDAAGNLQASAREARYQLLKEWATRHGVTAVLLGHTMDDQAETVLMHLARGSGVDGLAAMPDAKSGLFFRPLLGMRRDQLQDWLGARGVTWIDDPSNDDTRFDRVKARQMMPHLQALGLTPERLVTTSHHMARAQISLNRAAYDFAKKHVQVEGADLLFPKHVVDLGNGDTAGRVVAGALMWISGSVFRPRYKALRDAVDAVLDGETRTLHGVKIVPEGDVVRLLREAGACSDAVLSQGREMQLIWDTRWQISYAEKRGVMMKTKAVWPADLRVQALGGKISEVKDWRLTGASRDSLMATPAIFDGETLISAPAAGLSNGFSAQFVADFHRSLLTH